MSTANSLDPFHLAIPVNDLEKARNFYGKLLGCSEGRSTPHWVDFNFFGHQLVVHLVPNGASHIGSSAVDDHDVPIPHFGIVLSMEKWQQLADRLTTAQVNFVIKPCIRFKGEVGEQVTMFFLDPFNNALEFKAFQDITQLFAK